ncbi:MAG: site-specific DNA-methyltransferase [Deferribacteraceae bacterium]|nr:site-specific DNA-methyltransferase [Deferribacteraceae bacterium]
MNLENRILMSIPEASRWAADYLKKPVSPSNISYLVQYAQVKKTTHNGIICIYIDELKEYYDALQRTQAEKWNGKQGFEDILAFANLREKDTTKHIHRLHPYKGKFIPQLAEYFLDSHTDELKREVYFSKGDIILDPFCGSGTALAQANELGMHAVGVDISHFNSLISNCKIAKVDLNILSREIKRMTDALTSFVYKSRILDFDNELLGKLNLFNLEYFPSYEYKIAVKQKAIREKEFAKQKEAEFIPIYEELVKKHNIRLHNEDIGTFMNKWFLPNVISELRFAAKLIKQSKDRGINDILKLILSRTMRSCRATTHSDLATLIDPVNTPYYCTKHYKICKPIFTIAKWWATYSKDTIARYREFGQVSTLTNQLCLTGDSRTINIFQEVPWLSGRKIDGIFSSPPYVGMIDYHEQHAYAYDLFGFPRHDESEIGPLCKGQGREAKEAYIKGIADVLHNCKKYMKPDFNIFLVANDKYGLYPIISERAGMIIVNRYNRPVINRTEKDKGEYSETIFHLRNYYAK